ncbi:hypothetical protein KBA73_05670 [Patescibacteria group bacterium]|nr:hypothetical protein [Patescibacteria group bacterium]
MRDSFVEGLVVGEVERYEVSGGGVEWPGFLNVRTRHDPRLVVRWDLEVLDHFLGRFARPEDGRLRGVAAGGPASSVGDGLEVEGAADLNHEPILWPVLAQPLLAGGEVLEESAVAHGGLDVAVRAAEVDLVPGLAHVLDGRGEERATWDLEDRSATAALAIAHALELGGPQRVVVAVADSTEKGRHEGTPWVDLG